MAIQKDNLLPAKEICNILFIKPNTLYSTRYKKESGIPVFRQGRYLCAIKQEFEKWYQDRRRICV